MRSILEIVFYDRRNNREVRASQLMPINLVEMRLVVDSEEYRDGPWMEQEKHPAYLQEHRLGTLGYRSDECPASSNWDLWLTQEDLIFLRIEEIENDRTSK